MLIHKTVNIAVEKGIIRSKSIIVDATHTLSKSNPISAIDILCVRSKQVRKAFYSYQENWNEKILVKKNGSDLEQKIAYSKELETLLGDHSTIGEVLSVKEKSKH